MGRGRLGRGRGQIATGEKRKRKGRSGGRRRGVRRGLGGRLGDAVLGAPLRSWAAHVVQLGPVGVERVAAEGSPQDGEGRREPRSLLVRLCAVPGHGRSAGAIRMPASPASCPWVATQAPKVHGGTIDPNSLKS